MDDLGDFLAISQRDDLAQHPGRAWPLVVGSTIVHPLVFIRWAKQGVWERLLDLAQQHGIALGMVFIDGTTVRAYSKVAGENRGMR